MKAEVEKIVSRRQKAVAAGTQDAAAVAATYGALEALPIHTEYDRFVVVEGALQLNSLLLAFFGDQTPTEWRAQADRVQAMGPGRDRQDDTPWLRSRRELVAAAQRLVAGEAAVRGALTAAWPFTSPAIPGRDMARVE